MFICPHCGSNSISQENVDVADKTISRIDYMGLSCSWSQSSLFIMPNNYYTPQVFFAFMGGI